MSNQHTILRWKCGICKKELTDEKYRINRKYHDECRIKKKNMDRHKNKKTFVSKHEWILHLLKRQPANMGMICAYAKTNPHCAKQLIVNLRKQGHHISLEGYQGFYKYMGFRK